MDGVGQQEVNPEAIQIMNQCDAEYESGHSTPEISSRVTCSDVNETVNDSIHTYSSDDSVLCYDQIERDTANSPHTSPSYYSNISPPLPSLSNNTELSTANDVIQNNDPDDDFSIVYEKKAPPSEVQFLEARYVSNIHNQRSRIINVQLISQISSFQAENSLTAQNQNNSGASISVRSLNSSSATSNNSLTTSDEDCIAIKVLTPIKRCCDHQQSAIEEAENKKKKKIECGVCFDGPDDIASNGRTLISTVCGHLFCCDCIKQAIKSARQCPQCRKRLTCKQYHPLYI